MTSASTPPDAKTPSVIRVSPESEQGVELLRARLSL
jgi:hypothetical protein